MKFDSIVIGGGMAGLSAALRLAEAGQKTLLMASGQSALHFSSGSIDLLESDGDPRAALPAFMAEHPDHPYSKVGLTNIEASLADLQRHCHEQGLPLFRQETNHQRLTPIGTLKSTCCHPIPAPARQMRPPPMLSCWLPWKGFATFTRRSRLPIWRLTPASPTAAS